MLSWLLYGWTPHNYERDDYNTKQTQIVRFARHSFDLIHQVGYHGFHCRHKSMTPNFWTDSHFWESEPYKALCVDISPYWNASHTLICTISSVHWGSSFNIVRNLNSRALRVTDQCSTSTWRDTGKSFQKMATKQCQRWPFVPLHRCSTRGVVACWPSKSTKAGKGVGSERMGRGAKGGLQR